MIISNFQVQSFELFELAVSRRYLGNRWFFWGKLKNSWPARIMGESCKACLDIIDDLPGLQGVEPLDVGVF